MGRRRARLPLFALLIVCAAPLPARAQSGAVPVALREQTGGWMKRIYAARGFRPLWIVDGRPGAQATRLLGYLETADADGLRPASYDVADLRERIADARTTDDLARVEIALTKAFVTYVRDQRRPRDVGMIWADRSLRPERSKPETILRAATFPKDFAAYVTAMGWMSPLYVRLRALAARPASEADAERLARNLDRARILPGPYTRHVVVDASSGRLWYYQAGEQAGTMRVVVGAKETPTPMLAGTLTWAMLNPYWNVPDYLARKSIAPKVLAGRSLRSLHMEALTGWSADARPLPAAAIDWHAVASGAQEVRLRELPWAGNSMGRVKFLFPNDEGIYLHDTPERELLKPADRHFSNGCIRLEDAPALGRWLLARPLGTTSRAPEQAVPLPVGVPVYLTYLTATATEAGLAFRPDIYGRDG